MFHIDGTYKLILDGFVLLVLGTEDCLHRFRPIAYSISLKEDTNAYKNVKIFKLFY